MIQANCPSCRHFLTDYITSGIHPNLAIAKELRPHVFRRVSPEFSAWCIRFMERLSYFDYNLAKTSAHRIARRERNALEYDFLIQNAIYNGLRANLCWIDKEAKYIIPILLEAGLFKSRRYITAKHIAECYIGYIVPKLIEYLPSLHTDHVFPQGLSTNLSNLPTYSTQPYTNGYTVYEESKTLRDKDNYMSEILEDGEIPTFAENSPPDPTILDEKDAELSDLYR
jgi:hypothetical protein